jgi:hypothetical protein
LPDEIRRLLEEVYRALATQCPTLAAMGARAVLDVVITAKVADVGSFPKKLKALEREGFIGRRNREYLAAALDAGSAAAHRGHRPSGDELQRVMDIVENLLQAVYVLPESGKLLAASTPRRIRAIEPNETTQGED